MKALQFFTALALLALTASAQATEPLVSTKVEPQASEELFAPAPVATPICSQCVGGYNTGAAWGFGSNCAAAQADLNTQTYNAAISTCVNLYSGTIDLCGFRVHVTTPCYWSPGYRRYVVDGYATFACQVYVGGPGCVIP